MRPAMRCQLGLPRRSDGTNWNAPSRLYRVTLTMCTVTGIGEATNRALFAVISGAPISSVRRTAPATTGMRLSTISPTVGSHWVAAFGLGWPGRLVLSNAGMLAATSVMVRFRPWRRRRAAPERVEPADSCAWLRELVWWADW